MNNDDKELREALASIEHERWAYWQKHMQGTIGVNSPRHTWDKDGNLTIPTILIKAWQRQIDTPYEQLSEAEKDSDREQVDRYWPLVQAFCEQRERLARIEENKYYAKLLKLNEKSADDKTSIKVSLRKVFEYRLKQLHKDIRSRQPGGEEGENRWQL